jgi:3-methyladenine DNA glycosylase AlkD
MNKYNINYIKLLFEENANASDSVAMSKYMKNKFKFFGIKKPLRNVITADFIKKSSNLSEKELINLVWQLWNEDEREMQYLAIDLINRYFKRKILDIKFLEKLIVNKSWWDSVDILYKHTGLYFKNNYEDKTLWNWVESDNIWLNRSAILFQLNYKNETNEEVLTKIIISLKDKKDFFIQKAIGWILREYSKTNPNFVVNFIEEYNITGLAKREALKIINKEKY